MTVLRPTAKELKDAELARSVVQAGASNFDAIMQRTGWDKQAANGVMLVAEAEGYISLLGPENPGSYIEAHDPPAARPSPAEAAEKVLAILDYRPTRKRDIAKRSGLLMGTTRRACEYLEAQDPPAVLKHNGGRWAKSPPPPTPRANLGPTPAKTEQSDAGEAQEDLLLATLTPGSPAVELAHDDNALAPVVPAQAAPILDDVAVQEYLDLLGSQCEDFDMWALAARRTEQGLLQRILRGGRSVAPCAFCGRELPVEMLVAAHLQKRSELTARERADIPNNAALACRLGCDSLYELGYMAVSDTGHILTTTQEVPEALADVLANLEGTRCAAFRPETQKYFAARRQASFRH